MRVVLPLLGPRCATLNTIFFVIALLQGGVQQPKDAVLVASGHATGALYGVRDDADSHG